MLERLFEKQKNSEKLIPKIEGAVANIYTNRIAGWAFLSFKDIDGNVIDHQATEIEAYINGKPVGKTTANIFRPGIKENRNHPTGNCGFEIILNKKLDLFFIQKNLSVFANGIQLPNKFKPIFRLQKKNKDEDGFFFIHVPKTAGTSFRLMLYDVFDQKNIFPNLEDIKNNNGKYPKLQALKTMSKEKQNDIKMLSGHFPQSSGIIFPKKPKYLIFLRKPLNRAVSNLFHLQRLNDKYKDKSLEEIFEIGYNSVNCLQVRYLANAIGKKNLTQQDLNVAKKNLRNCHFLGITERFDESIDLAKSVFGWNFSKTRKDNVNVYKNYDLLSDELLLKIKTANNLDEELYHYALELFEQFIADPKKYLAEIQVNSNSKNKNAKKTKKAIPKKVRKPEILQNYQLIQKETKCALDLINTMDAKKEKNFTIKKSFLSIVGWAIDLPNKKIADEIYIALGDKYLIQATNNQERPDVVEMFENKDYLNAGFNVSSSIEDVIDGNYKLAVIILHKEKKSFLKYNTEISLTIQKKAVAQGKPIAKKTIAKKQTPQKPKSKKNFARPPILNKLEGKKVLSKLNWKVNQTNINTNNVSNPIKIEKDPIVITGWAMDMPKKIPFLKIFIVIDNNKFFITKSRIKRQDIVDKFKDSKFIESGFRVQVPLGKLSKGYHSIAVLAVDQDKKYQFKSSRRAVIEVI